MFFKRNLETYSLPLVARVINIFFILPDGRGVGFGGGLVTAGLAPQYNRFAC